MRSFVSYLSLLLGIFLGAIACEERKEVASAEVLSEKIGEQVLASLEKAEKVTTFRLGIPGQDTSTSKIGLYPVMRQIKTVSGQELVYFKNIFLKDETYRFERKTKIQFLPQFALKFEGGGKEAFLFLSVAGRQAAFNDENQVVDLSLSKSQLRHLVSLIE